MLIFTINNYTKKKKMNYTYKYILYDEAECYVHNNASWFVNKTIWLFEIFAFTIFVPTVFVFVVITFMLIFVSYDNFIFFHVKGFMEKLQLLFFVLFHRETVFIEWISYHFCKQRIVIVSNDFTDSLIFFFSLKIQMFLAAFFFSLSFDTIDFTNY